MLRLITPGTEAGCFICLFSCRLAFYYVKPYTLCEANRLSLRRFDTPCRDYDNLTGQFELQTTLLSDCSDEDTSLLFYLYDNVFECSDDAGVRYFVLSDFEVRLYRYLTEIPYYKVFLQVTSDYYNKSVKHKELNDLNEIFC